MAVVASLWQCPKAAFHFAARSRWSLWLFLLGCFILRIQGQTPDASCRAEDKQDIFILVDISGSMFGPGPRLIEPCVQFTIEKAREINNGVVDIVAFNTDWVALHPKLGKDFQIAVSSANPASQKRLLQFLDPKTYGALDEDRSWKGFLAAANAHNNGGTDLGAVLSLALGELEKRVARSQQQSDPMTSLQLWTLTDSDEQSATQSLDPLLERMKRLREKTWFQYHEIALLDPRTLKPAVRNRHEAITRAGFAVDYTRDLKQRVRIPSPWPAASAQPLMADVSLLCQESAGNRELEINIPPVFDTCGELGRRIGGAFALKATPRTPLPAGLALIVPEKIGTDSFGKPVRGFKLNGAWDRFAPGTDTTLEWELQYEFRADSASTIVDYLAQPKALLQVKVHRPSLPKLRWNFTASTPSSNCLSPGDPIGRIEFTTENLEARTVQVTASLVSDPPGAFTFAGGSVSARIDQAAGSSLQVVAGACDRESANGILTLKTSSAGPCPIEIAPVEQKFTRCFRHSAKIQWLGMDGARLSVPERIELAAAPSPAFTEAQIRDAAAFALKLADKSNPLARFIFDHSSSATRAQISAFGNGSGGTKNLEQFRPALAFDLQNLIAGAPFDPALLSSRQQPGGSQPVTEINRIALEQAFAADLRKRVNGRVLTSSKAGPSEAFEITISKNLNPANAIRIECLPEVTDYLKYAVSLVSEEETSPAENRRTLEIWRKGTHRIWMNLRADAGSRRYAGRLRITPSSEALLNASAEPILVGVEVYVPPPVSN